MARHPHPASHERVPQDAPHRLLVEPRRKSRVSESLADSGDTGMVIPTELVASPVVRQEAIEGLRGLVGQEAAPQGWGRQGSLRLQRGGVPWARMLSQVKLS